MKRHFTKVLIALFATSVFTSCIKEDMSNCRFGVNIHYFYILNKHYENRFGPDVEYMNISVFDKDDKFYDNFVIDNPTMLGNDNSINLPLPAGDWTLVSWGGDVPSYKLGAFSGSSFVEGLVVGQTSLNDFRLMLNYSREISSAQVEMSDKVMPLYYGDITPVTTESLTYTSVNIPVTNDVNDLVVKVGGLSNVLGANVDDFEIYATMSNGRYANDNGIADGAREIKYTQPLKVVGDTLYTTMSVLRLMEDSATEYLTVKSKYMPNDEKSITIPIVPTILKNPRYNNQEDLDREDTYEFVFALKPNADFSVTVIINEWEVVPIVPKG